MGKVSKPRNKFPYYKVHIYDNNKFAWIDARKEAFDTLSEAKQFVFEELSEQKSRIFEITERGRHVYEED